MGNGECGMWNRTHHHGVGGPSSECHLGGSTHRTSDQSDPAVGNPGHQQLYVMTREKSDETTPTYM